jgi:hypothetical protein
MVSKRKEPAKKDLKDVDPRLLKAQKDVDDLLREETIMDDRRTPFWEEMNRLNRGGRLRGKSL